FTSANICSSMAPCSTRAAAMFQYVVTMRYGALVLPRYTVRISSALDGVNCSRNQARAFRMRGSRRRSYSLSSRSALSYVVVAVDQGADTELLGEAAQLGGRGGPLVEIDEVGLDPTLGKETQRGAGVGALPDTEDLHVHTSCRSRTARRPARRAPAAWLRASPPGARLPRRAARGCASRPRAPP